jgi:hypothetical protein
VAVIVAPMTELPEESFTVPESEPVFTWAVAVAAKKAVKTNKTNKTRFILQSPSELGARRGPNPSGTQVAKLKFYLFNHLEI